MKQIFLFSLLFLSINTFSQMSFKKATLLNQDGSIKYGYVKLQNNQYMSNNVSILYKKKKKSNNYVTIDAKEIKQIDFPNSIMVLRKISLNNNSFYKFLKVIKKGKISLLELHNRYFLENKEYGLEDISITNEMLQEEKFYNKGIITVYVNKCKETHDRVYDDTIINLFELKEIIDEFNDCNNYSSTNKVPSTNAINKSLVNDYSSFAFGFGVGFNTTDYSNLEQIKEYGYTNSSILYNIYGAFVLHPDFLKDAGSLNFKINFATQEWSNFINDDNTVQIDERIQFVSIGTGINFNIIKTKKINPYIGISGAFLINKSQYLVSGTSLYNNLTSKDSYSNYTYNITLGTNFNIRKSKFDLNIEYYPGYKVTVKSLAAINGITDLSQKVETSSINLNLSYYIF